MFFVCFFPNLIGHKIVLDGIEMAEVNLPLKSFSRLFKLTKWVKRLEFSPRQHYMSRTPGGSWSKSHPRSNSVGSLVSFSKGKQLGKQYQQLPTIRNCFSFFFFFSLKASCRVDEKGFSSHTSEDQSHPHLFTIPPLLSVNCFTAWPHQPSGKLPGPHNEMVKTPHGTLSPVTIFSEKPEREKQIEEGISK